MTTFAMKTAADIETMIAGNPALAPKALKYLEQATAAGKRRNRKSQALLRKLRDAAQAPQEPAEAPKRRRATARRPEAKAAPAAPQSPVKATPKASDRERITAALKASNEAFLAAYFAD